MLTFQPEVGDSVLAHLAGEVDTLRVARTIATLNATPERWTFIMQKIEEKLGEHPDDSEPSRPGPRTSG